METEANKFAETEPFVSTNEVDKLGDMAGLNISNEEELGLKDKLEKRDEERLDFDNQEE